MGCLCPTFREEPVTRPCVGWAGPSLSTFLDGFPTPPELPPSSKALGRGSHWRTPAGLERSPLRGRYVPKGDL